MALVLAVSAANVVADDKSELIPTDRSGHAFTLNDPSGEPITLSAQRSRGVVLHFFATWCEPCREELPALRRLVERTTDRDLTVLAISVAEVPIRVRRFLGEMPLNFPVLLDQDRAVAKSWGVASLPTTFILDTDLKARLAVEREYDWDKLDVATVLENLSKGGKQ